MRWVKDIERLLELVKDLIDKGFTLSEILDDALESCGRLGLSDEFCRRFLGLLDEELERIRGVEKAEDGLRLRMFAAKAMEMQKAGKEVFRLELGEPDFSAPERAVEAAVQALRKGLSKYTSSIGIRELREAIASKLSEKYGVDLKPDNVAITAGGTLATYAAIQVLTKPGDEVMVIDPAWPLYAHQARRFDRRVVKVETSFEDGWNPVEKIVEKMTKLTKMIILNYPNNPTGKVLDRRSFEKIIEIAEENNAWIMSDEVYSDFSYNRRAPSILEYGYERSYYLNSFSKTWGMTGFRVGYVVADPEIARKVSMAQSTAMTCIPEFVQRAALAALMDEESAKRNVELVGRRLKVLYEELSKSRLIDVKPPEGAMYIFPKIRIDGFDSWDFAPKLLEEKGVVVAPGACFGRYDDHLRISAVLDEDRLREAIKRLREGLEEYAELRGV